LRARVSNTAGRSDEMRKGGLQGVTINSNAAFSTR